MVSEIRKPVAFIAFKTPPTRLFMARKCKQGIMLWGSALLFEFRSNKAKTEHRQVGLHGLTAGDNKTKVNPGKFQSLNEEFNVTDTQRPLQWAQQ